MRAWTVSFCCWLLVGKWKPLESFSSFHLLIFQEWWTHLWLNEGFASWIEYLCVDHCFPEYDIWTQFVSADYTRAQELDALDNSHPIEVSLVLPSGYLPSFFFVSWMWVFCSLLRKNCTLTRNAKKNPKLHSHFLDFPVFHALSSVRKLLKQQNKQNQNVVAVHSLLIILSITG